jgi:superfamily I DNA and/or RNA helicase
VVVQELEGEDFDMVIIDEAAQAPEASSWIPVLKASHDGGRLVSSPVGQRLA